MARQYSSTAAQTTLSGTITNSATSFTVAATTGWPTSYPFTLILDPDTASEEVVNVTNVAGTTVTATRGQDGTTAVSHNSGAAVKHGVSARDFSEPQVHIDATAAHGATGAVVGTTNTQTLTGKTIDATANTLSNIGNSSIAAAAAIAVSKLASSSVTIGGATATLGGANVTSVTGMVLDATSTVGGVSGTTLAADHAAWTSWTPAVSGTGWALGNGTAYGRYIQIGKVVQFNATVVFGTTSTYGAGQCAISLPTASINSESQGTGEIQAGASWYLARFKGGSSTLVQISYLNTSAQLVALSGSSVNGSTLTSGNSISIAGTYQAA